MARLIVPNELTGGIEKEKVKNFTFSLVAQ